MFPAAKLKTDEKEQLPPEIGFADARTCLCMCCNSSVHVSQDLGCAFTLGIKRVPVLRVD